jgi:putative flippase GtrA
MNYTDLFFKFGIVGVSGTAVDFGITYSIKE